MFRARRPWFYDEFLFSNNWSTIKCCVTKQRLKRKTVSRETPCVMTELLYYDLTNVLVRRSHGVAHRAGAHRGLPRNAALYHITHWRSSWYGVCQKTFLFCKTLPFNLAVETAIQPLIWCSEGSFSQGSSSPEECLFTDIGRYCIYALALALSLSLCALALTHSPSRAVALALVHSCALSLASSRHCAYRIMYTCVHITIYIYIYV